MGQKNQTTTADWMDWGILAYRDRDYGAAIRLFQQVLDVNAKHWRAKLYLAMCHYYGGEVFTAHRHLQTIVEQCQEPEVHRKALSALEALNSQVQGNMPDMSCQTMAVRPSTQQKKPAVQSRASAQSESERKKKLDAEAWKAAEELELRPEYSEYYSSHIRPDDSDEP